VTRSRGQADAARRRDDNPPPRPADGVLVIDKPEGLTSHDVVAVVRRLLHEKRIGHTGTLDPMATGVLALACGRATRLVSLLAGREKSYRAEILFGVTTDSYDVTGIETSRSVHHPTREALMAALDRLRGSYLQPPPPVSAKKIQGQRSYALARAGTPVQPEPVPVTVAALTLVAYDHGVATVDVTGSAGFYVRALAQSAGDLAGTGACLQSLRRTRTGAFGLADAVTLDVLQAEPDAAWAWLVPMKALLPDLPAFTVNEEGLTRLGHGRDLGPAHAAGPWASLPAGPAGAGLGDQPETVRILGPHGDLLALATPVGTSGLLHPSAVLM
jgi:tRNA pseudouridine55 synthase